MRPEKRFFSFTLRFCNESQNLQGCGIENSVILKQRKEIFLSLYLASHFAPTQFSHLLSNKKTSSLVHKYNHQQLQILNIFYEELRHFFFFCEFLKMKKIFPKMSDISIDTQVTYFNLAQVISAETE